MPRGEPAPAADGLWNQARRGLSLIVIYWAIHACVPAGAFFTGVSALRASRLCRRAVLAAHVRHHRRLPPLLRTPVSYRTSRAFQFVLAFLGCTAIQKGPLWWAGGHRRHHRFSDQPGDMHSPREGFWYAHQSLDLRFERWGNTEIEMIQRLRTLPGAQPGSTAGTSCLPTLLGIACYRARWSRSGWSSSASASRRPSSGTPPTRSTRSRTASGQPALRNRRRQPQQPVARAADARRGVAQQPPPLHGRRPATASSGGRST